MKTGASLKNRQGGAVAVMVGISIVLLVGFLAMVIDLGHLYIAKSGLQNAADAAALSGAKELDGTQGGVTSARDRAIEAAGKNTFFGDVVGPNIGYQLVSLSEANITFSDSPYTPDLGWKSYNDAYNAPGGLGFIKVDTGQQNLHTVFAVVWNIFNMSTYGRAVAGRLETSIAPIGLCAIDLTKTKYVPTTGGYLFEYGFQRGVSYDFAKVNGWRMGLASGTELYLHPTATSADTCTPSGGSADFITPFLCTGKSTLSGINGAYVYSNTGLAAGKSIAAINTRFDLYGPPLDASLDYTACPPDANIKEFGPSTAAFKSTPPPSGSGWMLDKDGQPFGGSGVKFSDPDDTAVIPRLSGWLADIPDPPGLRHTPANFDQILADPETKKADSGCEGNCSNNYGVLWSYTRPIDLSGATPLRPSASAWPTLYPGGPTANSAYDTSFPAGSCFGDPNIWYRCPSPYQAVSGTYFQGPNPSHPAQRDRRVLNVVIVNCSSGGSGICEPLPVLGVGRFFMQAKASQARFIFGEFDGLVPQPLLSAQIRLFQ